MVASITITIEDLYSDPVVKV